MIADRILLSEAVFTGNTLEPFAGGVAIAGNRVLAAGSKDEVMALAGSDTLVEDYGARLIAPGFNDSHLHFASAAALNDPDFCVNLMGCTASGSAPSVCAPSARRTRTTSGCTAWAGIRPCGSSTKPPAATRSIASRLSSPFA